ncbi:MAG: DoxX family protein [Deltaproteobacteria bacterium]|nr:DoxX family protein [Deltaproteobacteria bacterium]
MSRNVRIAATVARYLLGLIFFVFGLNGFLHFLPMPPMPGPAGALMGAFAATGYMFPMIKGTEVLGGLLLLSNRMVPFALVLLAPIIVNILAFHTVLTPPNPMAFMLVALEAFLGWAYFSAFRPMFTTRSLPSAESASDPVDATPAKA